MKRLLCMAVALGVLGYASAANAQIVLDVQPDGSAALKNIGAAPVIFDGYQIQDVQNPGRLLHGNLRSVESLIGQGKVLDVITALGAGALGLSPAGLSPNNIAELTAGLGGTLQPGASWSLGNIFPPGTTSTTGYRFGYNGPGGFVNLSETNIEVVPEPSTLALCALGLIGLVACARRRK